MTAMQAKTRVPKRKVHLGQGSADFPAIIDVLRTLQKRN